MLVRVISCSGRIAPRAPFDAIVHQNIFLYEVHSLTLLFSNFVDDLIGCDDPVHDWQNILNSRLMVQNLVVLVDTQFHFNVGWTNMILQTEQSGIVFKIQILTSSRPLAKNDKRLKGLKDVDYYKEGGIYKYTYGASPDYNKVLRSKRSITDKFKDAFIIAFKNGEKINVNTAISEFKKNRNK